MGQNNEPNKNPKTLPLIKSSTKTSNKKIIEQQLAVKKELEEARKKLFNYK